jgi:hypothetical protein
VTMSCVLFALSVLKNLAYCPVPCHVAAFEPCPSVCLVLWVLDAVGAWLEVFLGSPRLGVLMCCACDSQLAPQGAGAVNVHGADLAMY